ncbi:hypothetical protein [Clostridium estertheticum]|nr:hypothetical protein [Clostridium estertheticum]
MVISCFATGKEDNVHPQDGESRGCIGLLEVRLSITEKSSHV